MEDEGPSPPPPWKVAEVRGLLQAVVDEIVAEEVAEILAGQQVDLASPGTGKSSPEAHGRRLAANKDSLQ